MTLYSGPSLDAAQFAVPGHILETVTVHSEIFCQKSFLNDVEIKSCNTQLISITVSIWQLRNNTQQRKKQQIIIHNKAKKQQIIIHNKAKNNK